MAATCCVNGWTEYPGLSTPRELAIGVALNYRTRKTIIRTSTKDIGVRKINRMACVFQ